MKKKKTTKQAIAVREYDSQRETRVLLEEMHRGIETIGKQHGSMAARLDRIESKLSQQDQELQIIKANVHENTSELKSVKTAVMEIDAKVDKLNTKFDTNISQNEDRFNKIEEKLGIA